MAKIYQLIIVMSLLIVTFLGFSSEACYGNGYTRRYVTMNGAGIKDGSSWGNAFDKTQLQTAINTIATLEVWVAAGTYTPTTEVGGSGARYKTFQLKNGVAVYGGFAGNETLLTQRNISANETILSGDLNGDDNYGTSPWTGMSENCYHVFYHPYGFGLDTTAILNGFTIKGGNADGTDPDSYGGGMYNNGNSPKLSYLKFINNNAGGNAGAVYMINASNCQVSNSTFTYNQSSITSGACNVNASSPAFTSCVFSNNSSVYGGGAIVFETNAAPTIISCTFTGNSTTSGTGGAASSYGSSPTFTNCLFTANTSPVYAGAFFNTQNSSSTLTNCTMFGNSSQYGGAIFTDGTALTINNSIIWGNSFTSGTYQGRQIYFSSGANTVNYSCYSNAADDINGSATTTSCIQLDPLFVSPSGNDFRIYGISPCADAGNDTYNVDPNDIRGVGYPRKLSKTANVTGTIDMGAYEFKYGSDPECVSPLEVTNTDDAGPGSLRTALLYACNNGTITFNASLNGQTILLTSGELWLSRGVVIDATSLADGITISGGGVSRVFNVDAPSQVVTVKNVKIINGYNAGNGGGVYVNSGRKVTFMNSSISGCNADAGAGLFQGSSDTVMLTTVTIQNCTAPNGAGIKQQSGTMIASALTLSANTATYQGGGIYQTGGIYSGSNSVIKGNSALWGAGIYFENGTQSHSNDSIKNNTAIGSGSAAGAIYHKQGTLTLTGCNLAGNTAVTYGGAIYTELATASLTASGGSIVSNITSDGNGGGIYIGNGTVKLKNGMRMRYNAAQKVSNNTDGGAIYLSNGSLTIDTSYISNNSAYRNGGGIYINASTSTFTATGDSIARNTTTTDAGAGLYVYQGSFNLKRTIIYGNTNIHKGAGMFIWGSVTSGVIDSCQFKSNITRNATTDVNYGGGLFVNNAAVTVTNSTFTGNKATNTNNLRTPKGGAIYMSQGTLTSTGNTFTSNLVNTTKGLGGAMFNDNATVNNTSCTFTTDSTGRNGGAIYTNASTSQTNNVNCTFTGNYAEYLGGAIYMNNGTVNNTSCTFATNKANLSTGAAGVVYQNNGTSTSKACTFNGNQAYAAGAFGLRAGTANIINSLLYDNTGADHAGAIGLENILGTLNLINSTVTGNTATLNGGGIGIQYGTVVIKNSIIWGNTAASGAQIKNAGLTAVTVYNSDYSNQTGDISGTVTPTSCINTYPNFISEVSKNFSLGGNSPCLDLGNDAYCSETNDIRGAGYSRKLNKLTGLTGTIDMGAYEYKYSADPTYGCTNPTSGGAIKGTQFGCTTIDPDEIADSVAPSGEHGTIQYQWQKSTTSASAGFSDISGATNSSFNPGSINASTWYKRLARVDCMGTWTGAGESNVINVTVYPTFIVGSIGANQLICYNSAPAQLTGTAPTGGSTPYTYQWQSSTDSINYADISGATNLNFQPGSLTSVTYYRQLQTSPVCGTLVTNKVKIRLYPQLIAGTIAQDQTVCSGSAPQQLTSTPPTGGNTPYTYQWQSATTLNDGPPSTYFSSISGATNSVYTPAALTQTTHYRLLQYSAGGCGTVSTDTLTVTVEATPVAGSLTKIPNLASVCDGRYVSFTLTAGTGGNGRDTILYRTKAASTWSEWNTITTADSVSTAGKTDVEIKTYRLANYCPNSDPSTISWIVNPPSAGGQATGGKQVCTGTNSTVLSLTNQTGSVVIWQYSEDSTAWNNISGSTGNTYTAQNLTVNTWYRAVVKSGDCAPATSGSTKITMVNSFNLAGYARYYNNPLTPLNGLKIILNRLVSGTMTVVDATFTQANGYYSFAGVPNGTYGLTVQTAHPSGQWQTWNGVNMTDYLLVYKHVTTGPLLPDTPPVVRIAGDVKAPQNPPFINMVDASAIQMAAKYGWGNPPYFQIPKWVFSGVDAASRIDTFAVSCGNFSREIRGLCAGDVNGSYLPPNGNKIAVPGLELVNDGIIPVTKEMVFLATLETLHTPSLQMGALTLMLNYDPSLIQITGVDMPENAGTPPWFVAENGVLSIGWASLEPVTAREGQPILMIRARLTGATAPIRFTLNENPLSELADGDGNIIPNVKLTIPDASSTPDAYCQMPVALYPNPARDILNVEFAMESYGIARVELTTLQGVTILSSGNIFAETGMNKVTLNISDLANGIYLTRVTRNGQVQIQKLVVNK